MRIEARTHCAELRIMMRRRIWSLRRSDPASSSAPSQSRGGFALPELIVAMVILAVGILALASTAAGVMKQMRSGNQRALAAIVAQSRMETMRSLQCANLSSNSATTRGLKENWTIGATMNNGRVVAVKESVTYILRPGATSSLVITGFVPCT
jgi:prepilin-type N-terminal cleavage/methylation domain-containing protein